jgi:hypothetical protein
VGEREKRRRRRRREGRGGGRKGVRERDGARGRQE